MFIDFPSPSFPIEGMEDVTLPQMYRIRQLYDIEAIEDVEASVAVEMERILEAQSVAGKKVAVTAGSRGIPGYSGIMRVICQKLKEYGAVPFVVPAMGSHGGATGDGQRAILAEYGVTEQKIEASILSSMETVRYGSIGDIQLWCDKNAFEADGILIFNKVKPHTDFRGEVESGLCKMIAIGLGKHKGASEFHKAGFACFSEYLPLAAKALIATGKVIGGLGVVQNAHDKICAVKAALPDNIIEIDKELLRLAKKKIARFKFDSCDVLVIEQIGKNISGAGFDPNIVGRTYSGLPGFDGILKLKKLVILSLTAESCHNGVGIALADVSTRRCLRDIDWDALWTNSVTSTELSNGRIPLYTDSDMKAMLLAIRTCNRVQSNKLKLAKIKNTLYMDEIEVSEALYNEIKDNAHVEYICGPYDLEFDVDGNVPGLGYSESVVNNRG